MTIPYKILSILTALILLAAASLKLFGISISPVAQIGIFHHPALMVAVVESEFIIAVWLLSGVQPALVRKLTIGLFSLFTIVSAFAFFTGVASCGCFGPIQVNPLYVCLFDIGVVLAFLFCAPKEHLLISHSLPGVLRPLIGGVALSFIVLGAMQFFYPGINSTFAKLSGKKVLVSPLVLDLGWQKAGTEIVSSIKVSNFGTDPVYVAGGSSDCTCILTEKLPCNLQSGETIEIPVRIKLPDAVGSFHRQAFLWTDDNQRYLPFKITGVMTR